MIICLEFYIFIKLLSVEHFIDSYNCYRKINLETCAIYLKCQKKVIQDFEQNSILILKITCLLYILFHCVVDYNIITFLNIYIEMGIK